MAFALLHAGVHQPPPNKAGPALKVPAALVPPKPGAEHAVPAAKPQFKNLLDQLTQAVKGASEGHEKDKDKLKLPKVKTEAAEKPKDVKKGEARDIKAEAYEASLAALMTHQPKVEAAKAKAPEAEAAQGTLEKTKPNNLRDRRTGAELGVPAAVTAASAEIARSQAQQNSPRAERSEERQRVFVVDKRTEPKDKEKLKLPGAEAAAQQPVNGPELQAQQTKVDTKTAAAEVQVSFQSVGGKPKDSFDLKPQNTPVSPRDAVTFQQYLVEKGYGQLVDQARIVLKDQNAGEIRMTLYPESLGKVKVNLNLSDNSLAGQIFVENQTVKDVFQSNMDGLLQAFRDGGWNDMSLEVSVGNGNGGGQAGNQQPQAAQARDYGRQVSQTGAPEVRERIGSWNDRQINLTA